MYSRFLFFFIFNQYSFCVFNITYLFIFFSLFVSLNYILYPCRKFCVSSVLYFSAWKYLFLILILAFNIVKFVFLIFILDGFIL